ncbi:TetR/AcrR family transcriptional regulator [Actinomadura nitritigenes]|uniref:TetR/AcrR family transcriptional regulator n=1 Tax=Actinomadura nitritigenes TaxID=134602 RepID=A0ABS3RGW5_9ACTN|nr:TetR/AcrR family transcriptional regulator [Actinomadura nitritigenes]
MPRPRESVRVLRTRTLLRQALVELIEERGFDRVTVGQITERAMVSRAAFYRNYRDKYHLVEEIFDEAMDVLRGSVADPDARPALELWASFFDHVAHYHRLYGALLSHRGSQWFAVRMRSSLSAMVAEHIPSSGPTGGLVPSLVAAMFVQAITWWLDNDRPLSSQDMAIQTGRLAGAIIAEANSRKGAPRPG